MPMIADAFENYLVEATAMQIAKECDQDGMLAAAIHARHKVRKTDLQLFFDRANEASAKTWERYFYTYCLIVYASAAYRDVDAICKQRKGGLEDVEVIPHWSRKAKSYPLKSVVFQEPLNLFPGLSTENLSNNRTIIDQHMVAKYQDGTSKSMAMMQHNPQGELTASQRAAQSMRKVENIISSSVQPTTPIKQGVNFETVSTPISKTLGGTAQHIVLNQNIADVTEQYDASTSNAKKRMIAKEIHDHVAALYLDAVALTKAGEEHYDNLLKNYENAMKLTQQSSDIFHIKAVLTDAKQNWATYRAELVMAITRLKDDTKDDFPLK